MRRHAPLLAAGAALGLAVAGTAVVSSGSTPDKRPLPNHRLTPGLAETTDLAIICGQRTGERRAVSQATKDWVFDEYGVTVHSGATYEVDHLIPLELGGSNDIRNLWPEPAPSFHEKDVLENRLHKLVCDGTLPVATAQMAIARDWVSAYRQYVATLSP